MTRHEGKRDSTDTPTASEVSVGRIETETRCTFPSTICEKKYFGEKLSRIHLGL